VADPIWEIKMNNEERLARLENSVAALPAMHQLLEIQVKTLDDFAKIADIKMRHEVKMLELRVVHAMHITLTALLMERPTKPEELVSALERALLMTIDNVTQSENSLLAQLLSRLRGRGRPNSEVK
jgi:hypothetical protein